jgi:murein L,D-transpeptidase YafK
LSHRLLVRSPLAFATIVAAIVLAGCDPDGVREVNGRHMHPLSGEMLAEIESKNMEKESSILVRIFKQESELEVWKEDKTGRFALVRTYPICRWSGELGPKFKTGDRQAPEGFYTITPGQMNPKSSYYLAINMGFPNAYDRANGYTGAFLMVHGDCLSAGCYAMTDEQIAEIYALARESFLGGQKSFQIQAYPFRMTPLNLAKHRNSPHMAFWKMLKQGYDHFEVTRLEPKVNVCEKRYVFGAETSGKFSATERCPAYKVPEDIAAAVQNKQRRDEVKIAELVNRGTPALPVKTGIDGGMNPTFLTAMKLNGAPGVAIRTAAGTVPNHVSPPAEASTGNTFSFASVESTPVSAPRSSVQVASAAPSSSGGIGSFFSNLFGSKDRGQATPEAAPKAKAAPASATQTAAASKPKTEPRQPAETKTASAAQTKPQAVPPSRQESDADPQSSKPTAVTDLLNGAAPTVPSGGFDGRFGVWR